jgi:hypothetical protein
MKRLKAFYEKYDIGEVVSILAGIVMGVFNLVALIRSGDDIFIALMSFYFGMALIRSILLLLKRAGKDKASVMNLSTFAFLVLGMPAFNASVIYLIDKEPQIDFPYSFLIYGYALYAFYKLINACVLAYKGRKHKSPYLQCLSVLSFLSAFYTIMSLTVNLAYAGLDTPPEGTIKNIEWAFLGIIGIYEIAVFILLLVRGIKGLPKKKGSAAS